MDYLMHEAVWVVTFAGIITFTAVAAFFWGVPFFHTRIGVWNLGIFPSVAVLVIALRYYTYNEWYWDHPEFYHYPHPGFILCVMIATAFMAVVLGLIIAILAMGVQHFAHNRWPDHSPTKFR